MLGFTILPNLWILKLGTDCKGYFIQSITNFEEDLYLIDLAILHYILGFVNLISLRFKALTKSYLKAIEYQNYSKYRISLIILLSN
jgi:hypothetical protein